MAINHIGSTEAMQIRTAARALAEIKDLRRTSSLREIFYDLGEALDDLCDPIAVLADEFTETYGGPCPADVPDVEQLRSVVAGLKFCANNL